MDTTREAASNINESRVGRSVSLDHAAELLGVSRRTIYNRIREGRLQTVKTLLGSQRVLLESVDVIREQGVRGAGHRTSINSVGHRHEERPEAGQTWRAAMRVTTSLRAGSDDGDTIVWGN